MVEQCFNGVIYRNVAMWNVKTKLVICKVLQYGKLRFYPKTITNPLAMKNKAMNTEIFLHAHRKNHKF